MDRERTEPAKVLGDTLGGGSWWLVARMTSPPERQRHGCAPSKLPVAPSFPVSSHAFPFQTSISIGLGELLVAFGKSDAFCGGLTF